MLHGITIYLHSLMNIAPPFLLIFNNYNRFFMFSVRIANELGRGDAKTVRFSIKVLISTSIVIGVFFTIICLVFGNSIGYLFTSDVAVAKTVSKLSVLLAISVLLNSIYPVLSGSLFYLSFFFLHLCVPILNSNCQKKPCYFLLAHRPHLNDYLFMKIGVAVGAGMQGTVAVINLCCYYLIGIPIGAVLGYVAHLEVEVNTKKYYRTSD